MSLEEVTKEDFEKGNLYCVASEEHLKHFGLIKTRQQENYIKILDSGIHTSIWGIEHLKQIQLINNKWYFVEEQQDKLTKSIEESYEKKPKNNFEEYGFKADFEGEILKEIDNCYYGWMKFAKDYPRVAVCWMASGTTSIGSLEYGNLTPYIEKKEWYENKDNFPALMVREYKGILKYSIVKNIDHVRAKHPKDGFRLATKEEKDSLFCEQLIN